MKSATLKIDIWTHGRKHLAKDNTDLPELFAHHTDHITRMLAKGHLCGQVVDERFDGWWAIEVKGT